MPRTKKEAGQAYLDGILKLVPEAEREAVKKALAADAIAEAAGEGVLLRDDYSRQSDLLKENEGKVLAYYNSLQGWYGEKAQDLQKGEEAQLELAKIKGTQPSKKEEDGAPPSIDVTKLLSKEEAAKLLQQSQQQLAGDVSSYAAYLTNMGLKHQHEFGEPLDVFQLDKRARAENKRLDDLYLEVTKDKREAKMAQAAKKHEEELRAKVRAEVEEEMRKQPQFPYPHLEAPDPLGNATLSGIAGEDKKAFGVQAATDEFYRLRRST